MCPGLQTSRQWAAEQFPRPARLPAQGLSGREGAGRPGPVGPARRWKRLVWLDGVFFSLFFLFDTYVASGVLCVRGHMCTTCVPGAGGSPRRASDPQEQELHVVMGARDQIRVLYQS